MFSAFLNRYGRIGNVVLNREAGFHGYFLGGGFAGSDRGADRAAFMAPLVITA
jgi:hypothetical protein